MLVPIFLIFFVFFIFLIFWENLSLYLYLSNLIYIDDTANRSGFNFNQIQSIARILLASAADLAEIS